MSGHIFKASCPGLELPRPMSLPTAFASLHIKIAAVFLIEKTMSSRFDRLIFV
jgi:hypothetical protein